MNNFFSPFLLGVSQPRYLKYAAQNVRGIAHKEVELDSALNEKQIENPFILHGSCVQLREHARQRSVINEH